jgi:hypothetical protein
MPEHRKLTSEELDYLESQSVNEAGREYAVAEKERRKSTSWRGRAEKAGGFLAGVSKSAYSKARPLAERGGKAALGLGMAGGRAVFNAGGSMRAEYDKPSARKSRKNRGNRARHLPSSGGLSLGFGDLGGGSDSGIGFNENWLGGKTSFGGFGGSSGMPRIASLAFGSSSKRKKGKRSRGGGSGLWWAKTIQR